MTTRDSRIDPLDIPGGPDPGLDRHLDGLRAATAALVPPPAVEARLMKAFAARHAWWRRPLGAFGGSGPGLRRYAIPAVALAASLGMAGWTVLTPLLHLQSAGMEPEVARFETTSAAGDAPFIALQPLEQIALEPQASVVSTTFPRSWLSGMGLPVDPERAAETVRADMLVGAGGQPLAVRISE